MHVTVIMYVRLHGTRIDDDIDHTVGLDRHPTYPHLCSLVCVCVCVCALLPHDHDAIATVNSIISTTVNK